MVSFVIAVIVAILSSFICSYFSGDPTGFSEKELKVIVRRFAHI